MSFEIQKIIEKLYLKDFDNPKVWKAVDELAALIGYLVAANAQNKKRGIDFNEVIDSINSKIIELADFTADTLNNLTDEHRKKQAKE